MPAAEGGRQPTGSRSEHDEWRDRTADGEPLSKKAVASPRSRLGNHSETAFVAAGQLRTPRAQEETEAGEAVEAAGRRCEHRCQGVPGHRQRETATRPEPSMSCPKQVWPMEYAIRNAITRFA